MKAIYELLLEIKGVPYLAPQPEKFMRAMSAADAASCPPVCLQVRGRLYSHFQFCMYELLNLLLTLSSILKITILVFFRVPSPSTLFHTCIESTTLVTIPSHPPFLTTTF